MPTWRMAFEFRLFNSGRMAEGVDVPDIPSSTVVILLGSILGMLVLMWFALHGLGRILIRIERRLVELQTRDGLGDERLSAVENPGGGAFETFLAEDPARRQLPKKEQFAAYRKWRQENGLNWSNSP